MAKSKYANLDSETFDRLLAEVMDEDNASASDLLLIPGVYEIVSEHYNNAVLDKWEESHEAEGE